MIKKNFISKKDWVFEDIIPGETPTYTWGFPRKKDYFQGKADFKNLKFLKQKNLEEF
jgi:hypothetical protein